MILAKVSFFVVLFDEYKYYLLSKILLRVEVLFGYIQTLLFFLLTWLHRYFYVFVVKKKTKSAILNNRFIRVSIFFFFFDNFCFVKFFRKNKPIMIIKLMSILINIFSFFYYEIQFIIVIIENTSHLCLIQEIYDEIYMLFRSGII